MENPVLIILLVLAYLYDHWNFMIIIISQRIFLFAVHEDGVFLYAIVIQKHVVGDDECEDEAGSLAEVHLDYLALDIVALGW